MAITSIFCISIMHMRKTSVLRVSLFFILMGKVAIVVLQNIWEFDCIDHLSAKHRLTRSVENASFDPLTDLSIPGWKARY